MYTPILANGVGKKHTEHKSMCLGDFLNVHALPFRDASEDALIFSKCQSRFQPTKIKTSALVFEQVIIIGQNQKRVCREIIMLRQALLEYAFVRTDLLWKHLDSYRMFSWRILIGRLCKPEKRT